MPRFGGSRSTDCKASETKALPEYVAATKVELSAAVSAGSKPVQVVMGNEAGDLDSMACAVVYARLEALRTNETFFPVMNVPRNEMRLRKDNQECFRLAGIDESYLICIDELPILDLASKGRLALTMVDHNELSCRQAALAGSVIRIVDHHRDTGLYNDTVKPADRNVVFPMGSATSLVTEIALAAGPSGETVLADPACRMMLASTILIDTNNLEDKAKTTDRDVAAMGVLREKASGSQTWGAESNNFLFGKRGDLQGFSAVDVMKKDLKFMKSGNELFAIASAVTSLKDQCSSAEAQTAFLAGFADFVKISGIQSFYAILTAGATADSKTIITCIPQDRWATLGPQIAEKLAAGSEYGGIKLVASEGSWPEGGAHPEVEHAGFVLKVFEMDKGASRKQLLPFFQDFFKA